jgi:hypothetical protein
MKKIESLRNLRDSEKPGFLKVEELLLQSNEEVTEMSKPKRMEIAEKLAKKTSGKVWTPNRESDIVRVYIRKGYASVNEDGINIDKVGGHECMEVTSACEQLGLTSYRR